MKVLVVAGRPPWPAWRGDQLRARQLLEALTPAHEVTLLAPATTSEPPLPGGARRETYRARPTAWAALRSVGGLWRGWPLQALPFHQPDLGRRLRSLAPRYDVVVLQLVRLLPHLEDLGSTPLVADLVDCLSLNAATRAMVDRPMLRPVLAAEARRVALAEARLVGASRAALVVSARDRSALLGSLAPEVASRLAVAPIAMSPGSTSEPMSAPNKATVMLSGNLGYFPNRDALRFFLADVWPRLRETFPRLELRVAGDRPPASLERRIRRAGGTLVARPPDLRALLREATVAVAPLRCGSGVPLKVLDAWASGVPVVASPFAADGAGGEPERDLLVATTPAEWVAQVGRLLTDLGLARRLAEAGRDRLAELAPERIYPLLRDLVTGVA